MEVEWELNTNLERIKLELDVFGVVSAFIHKRKNYNGVK